MIAQLLSRLTRPRKRVDARRLDVVLYNRLACYCCHTAEAVLRDAQGRYDFTYSTVDVDTDPGLAEAHGPSVPVVTVGGKVRFRGVVNPALLDRLLAAEAAGAE